MTPPAALSPEIRKVLSNLELLIATKKVGIREVERQLEVGRGTLHRVLNGRIALKLQTVLDILRVLEVAPKAFFSAVFDETTDGAHPFASSVRNLALPPSAGVPVFSRTEIKRMIEEALTERLSSTPAPALNSPKKDDPPRPRGRTPKKKA